MPEGKNEEMGRNASPVSRKGRIPLHASPIYLFWCLHKTSMSIVTEELEKAGTDVTPVQFAALTMIQLHPGIDQATLANEIGYDRATIGGVLDRLEKKEMMSRRVHPQDRRARALFIEDAGVNLIAEVEDKVAEAQKKILAPLPKEDHAKFLSMVAKLIREDLPHAAEF